MNREMTLGNQARRSRKELLDELLGPYTPKKNLPIEKEDTRVKLPADDGMITLVIFRWRDGGVEPYTIYMPSRATIGSLKREFARIYLERGSCYFANNQYENVIWSDDKPLKSFVYPTDIELFIFFQRGSVFNERIRSTYYNPLEDDSDDEDAKA
ncbi:hypothetical protein LPJ53_000843 [Coemansia erecta]|uniref:Uncharacterized protein n=1 Tax=Coemansia erecta TaxID=147472 RepID=A0A9W7Y153_9FUNG|nr:hypothetical protein LPJ53_000843 [Coemansia erecta]